MSKKIPQLRFIALALSQRFITVEMEYTPDVVVNRWTEVKYIHDATQKEKDRLEFENPSLLAVEEHGDSIAEFAQLHLTALGFEPAFGSDDNTLSGKPIELAAYEEKS